MAGCKAPEQSADMAVGQYGDEQVLVWRRSYDTPPPALEATDLASERWTSHSPSSRPSQIPLTEC